MSKTETKVKVRTDLSIKEPSLYKLIYLNDDRTSIEFVVSTLIDFFDYTEETATTITTNIHEEGSATVAVLPYEIAEQTGIEITMKARSLGFPLQIRIEVDE